MESLVVWLALCVCISELTNGGAGQGVSYCQNSDQCAVGNVCIDLRCVDKCLLASTLLNTCSSSNQVIGSENTRVPKYPSPLTQIGCTTNDQCPADRTCVGQRCIDPCLDRCGVNAVCQVVNHYPNCVCMQGFTGNPIEGCDMRSNSGCTTNDHCPADRTCVGQRCIDPCSNRCRLNAVCQVINHYPNCVCVQGYAGNPVRGCLRQAKAECSTNDQCPADRTCVGQRCVDLCTNRCGPNAMCQVINHYPNCVCTQGFTGNPVKGCESQVQSECSTNEQCPVDRACVGQKCTDPCLNRCGVNSMCKVVNHFPNCVCNTGFKGNPMSGCEPQVSAQSECTTNDQCPADRTCVGQKCVDPCSYRCGVHARCLVTNHIGNCVCNQGFTGNPGYGCQPQAQPECITNEQCPANLNCVGQKCVDPCVGRCGLNAVCQVVNHYPNCACQQGFTGNPLYGCAAQVQPECTTNEQCSSNLTCVGHKCVDLCTNRCGSNAVCQVTNHYPDCVCTQGYTGNPFTGCEPQVSGNIKASWPPSTGKKKFDVVLYTKFRWLGAYMYCLRHNKRLARVESEEENRQVMEGIHRTGLRGETFWVDGTDDAGEDLWFWVSTSKTMKTYENWDITVPNNLGNNEHCLSYFEWDRNRGYKWNDRNCWEQYYFICEYYE